MTGIDFCCWARVAGDNRAALAANVLRKSRRLILVFALRPLFGRDLFVDGRIENADGRVKPTAVAFAGDLLKSPMTNPAVRSRSHKWWLSALSGSRLLQSGASGSAPGADFRL